jgi:hypothetical protein
VCSGSIAYILTGFYDFDNVNVQQALCLSSYFLETDLFIKSGIHLVYRTTGAMIWMIRSEPFMYGQQLVQSSINIRPDSNQVMMIIDLH